MSDLEPKPDDKIHHADLKTWVLLLCRRATLNGRDASSNKALRLAEKYLYALRTRVKVCREDYLRVVRDGQLNEGVIANAPATLAQTLANCETCELVATGAYRDALSKLSPTEMPGTTITVVPAPTPEELLRPGRDEYGWVAPAQEPDIEAEGDADATPKPTPTTTAAEILGPFDLVPESPEPVTEFPYFDYGRWLNTSTGPVLVNWTSSAID